MLNYVGKILAQDVVDEESGLVFGKAAEKLTTAMLKRMVDAGIDVIRIAEDADEYKPDHQNACKRSYRFL